MSRRIVRTNFRHRGSGRGNRSIRIDDGRNRARGHAADDGRGNRQHLRGRHGDVPGTLSSSGASFNTYLHAAP
jgi:hypothetical protein